MNNKYKLYRSSKKIGLIMLVAASFGLENLAFNQLNHPINASARSSRKYRTKFHKKQTRRNVKQSTNSIFTTNNHPYRYNNKYITNVNGYLTANTWYRPKKILQNGENWRQSKSKDFRPLLMVWWPSQKVKANYVNYFNHLLSGKQTYYNEKTSDATLNKASEQIQSKIEKRISNRNGSIKWLQNTLNRFINEQPIWNIKSEHPVYAWGTLQGGMFKYINSSRTPWANSKYRYIGRIFIYQRKNNTKNYELLLGNDVDNSNPTVQAEDLNNVHYLLNISSILHQGASGNFDGGREDATGSLDYDVTQLVEHYFKDHYKMNNDKSADAHLNMLEDGAKTSRISVVKDHDMALTHDMYNSNDLLRVFTLAPDKRLPLKQTFMGDWLDRSSDYTENKQIPNYSYVNVHDGVQSNVGNIISDVFHEHPDLPTPGALKKAIQIYDQDEYNTDKKYASYNLPSAYSILLTNKDVVPRVYYGDLFMDGEQYMAQKSPYYDAITSLLKARMKYVSGGQQMRIQSDHLLTSVRFGKDNLKPTDKSSHGRLSGIATVTSTDPNLNLGNNKVTINMGADHADQEYRPLLMTTKNGLNVYHNDSDAKNMTVKTNHQGQLILNHDQVFGAKNPQVSGYLSTWVPVGAPSNQDVRTKPSTKRHHDGNLYHSNAALDSHVAYEGFSSLQPDASSNGERTDVMIAKNANLFKPLGITDFEFPAHYMPVKNDQTFVDGTEHNGYAFSDRYNLGMNGQATKYGTVNQLINANKALHAQGIHTLGDYVLNQIYDLPKSELTSVRRVDGYGHYDRKNHVYNKLYYSKTISSGHDYQAKYGGAFLNQLRKQYPDLFHMKQISTGQPIDAKHHIKQWSAKYFNGTNIQGRGMDYILQGNHSKYYRVGSNQYLPKGF
ncbi:hypothetical protein WR164_00850 [Philodulcilactobacillus myokoensis]|uniref:dextransucrase n=1 Tax=Philodulcilactobacillus myokoensis TaxID=2929573 RepID=A0A9W6AZH2_9LACO|nr:glycoside hydrolase family 70 protein [Philodulcilactobacillus myokoensis]GLB46106.1 hypothetical protein WR164_00850 [Philodulcilactobacillus myokoensis]